jgi:ribosomal protein L22
VSPRNPQDPQKGKPFEEVRAAQAAEDAADAAAREREAPAQPEPAPAEPRDHAAPEAEGTAAAQTGVDKDAAQFAEAAPTGGEPQAAPGDDAAPAEGARPAPAPQRRRDRRQPAPAGVTVRAQAKYVRTSARKARLVCDHIRGKDVVEARAILAYTPRAAAKPWSKLLESAVANAEHNHELVGEELKIAAVYADEGPTLKRFRPRAMGRATRIRKRTSHLTITLTPKEL